MRTDLRKQIKKDFKKIFVSWWIMQFLEKLWKMWESTEILNYSVSKPNYHTTKFFAEYLLVIEMKKSKTKQNKTTTTTTTKMQILMDKIVYLGLSILEFSKILMHAFWYDYVRPKYKEKEFFFIWIQTVLLFT